jgi:phage terminase large subunit-like protein
MAWSLATPDWQDRIRTGRSLIPDDLPLNKAAAHRAVTIFDKLRLPDVPGKPLLRDAAGDWFGDIVRALHGSIDAETGERMTRELFLLTPKKNSKTSYGAALMLTSVLINERPLAQYLLVAPSHAVADLAFTQIEGMIAADPHLCQMMHVQPHLKKVTLLATGAVLQVKSFDPAVLTGTRISWRGADLWNAYGDSSVTLDSILTRCDVVVCGVDPAQTS